MNPVVLNSWLVDSLGEKHRQGGRYFPAPIVMEAACRLGMFRVEEFEIVIKVLHEEHVIRVFRVRRAMADHPAHLHTSIPPAVRDALADLRAVEEAIDAVKVPRLDPVELHARVAMLEQQEAIA